MSDIPDHPDPPLGGPEAPVAVFPLVYANMVMIHGRAFDVMLDFAARQPEVASGPVRPDEIGVRVATSWAQLKSMIPLLTRVVADYEAANGVIPSPGFEEDSRS